MNKGQADLLEQLIRSMTSREYEAFLHWSRDWALELNDGSLWDYYQRWLARNRTIEEPDSRIG